MCRGKFKDLKLKIQVDFTQVGNWMPEQRILHDECGISTIEGSLK